MPDTVKTPYQSLTADAFWKTGVANHNAFDIANLWTPKFNIQPDHKIATFGSCFAQNIGRALQSRGYSWLNSEPAPFGLSADNATRFGYNVFTCRTGNIYTTSLLRQWVDWAVKDVSPPEEFWEDAGRYYDPFRPAIEPNGFKSLDEMLKSRKQTIAAFRSAILDADFFIFTLGLTESWFHRRGHEYPMCPGTSAGIFDSTQHVFRNQQFEMILNHLSYAFSAMSQANSRLRFLLTVSPVPLTATKSGKHVLVATTESKSVLRAVAGQMATNRKNVDYFPSYEIITAPPFRGMFFEPNLRSINAAGVNHVMTTLFTGLTARFGAPRQSAGAKPAAAQTSDAISSKAADLVCEERLLEAFGPQA